jgi:hypothetical protein
MTKRKDCTTTDTHDEAPFASSAAATVEPKQPQPHDDDDDDSALQILVSRIPSTLDETAVQRLLEEHHLGPIRRVALAYPPAPMSTSTAEEEPPKHGVARARAALEPGDRFYRPHQDKKTITTQPQPNAAPPPQPQHRGFGFATLSSVEMVHHAISQVRTVRGGAKVTSTRKYTLYLGPYEQQPKNDNKSDGKTNPPSICFLFAKQGKCPYGDGCKFVHESSTTTRIDTSRPTTTTRSSSKTTTTTTTRIPRPDAEKDCIHWKTRGRCRRLDKNACPYRHDPTVQQAAWSKRAKKQQQHSAAAALNVPTHEEHADKSPKKSRLT